MGVGIYSMPILHLLLRLRLGRYYVFLFSVFFALQAILPSLMRGEFFRAQPNFQVVMDYEKGAIRGFSPGPHKISVDSMGFRTTKDVNYSDKGQRIRVATVGGSTTQMIDIDDRRTWSHHLQEILDREFQKDFEVINTGMAGLRAKQNAATLKYISNFSPDLVLILVGTNDWRRHIFNQVMGISGKSPAYPWENFSVKNSIFGKIVKSFIDKRKRVEEDRQSRPVQVIKFKAGTQTEQQKQEDCAKGIDVKLPDDFPKEVSEDFSDALESIRDTCKQRNLKCMLMTQPNGYKPEASGKFRQDLSCNNRWSRPYVPLPEGVTYVLRDVDRMGRITSFYNAYTNSFAEQSGLLFCDLDKGVPPEDTYFYDEVHFTEAGTKKVAEVVFGCIKDSLVKANLFP